jgi:hypothetical protein
MQLDSDAVAAVLNRSGGEMARRHEALWQAVWQQPYVPVRVLELCRSRLAKLHGAACGLQTRAEGATSVAECAALEFTEIYGQDPQAITDELAAAVKTHFGEAGLVALIEALGVIDGRIRLGMMLGPLLATDGAHG